MSSPPQPAPPNIMPDRAEAYRRFFRTLAQDLEGHAFTNPETGKPWSWQRFRSGGPSWVRYGAAFAHNRVRAYVLIACGSASENTRILNELKKRRTEIEQEFGDKLDWDFRRNTIQQQCRIEIYRPGRIQDDAATLVDIRNWIIEHLCKLRIVFGPKWPD